ncbi:MAG: glycosyltransferase family 4 protein [Pyrinomonadaceae bacterium]
MNRKVVLLGPYPPPYGGVSIFISNLFDMLRNRGIRLWTFGDRELKDEHAYFMKEKRLEIVPLLLREGARKRIVDSAHFLIEYPSLLVPVWALLKLALRFEWFKIIHDGSLPSRYPDFNFLRRLLFRISVNSVTEFIVVSEDLHLWLRDEIKVKQNITTIPCLVPSSHRSFNAQLPAETEKILAPYLRHKRRVCSIGVFIPSYGFHHVAGAVEKIRAETGEDLGLILLDGTFAREEDYRKEVLRERDWITVLENVPNRDVYQILKKSNLFVRAFGHESYGISRIEAIWCGLPVVATTAGETRGMRLYNYGDEPELIRQIKAAFFERDAHGVQIWSELYRREAEENLEKLLRTIGVRTRETPAQDVEEVEEERRRQYQSL